MSRYFMQGTRLAWAERMMMDPSRSPTDHNDTQSPRQKRPCDKSAKPIHSGQKMPEDSVVQNGILESALDVSGGLLIHQSPELSERLPLCAFPIQEHGHKAQHFGSFMLEIVHIRSREIRFLIQLIWKKRIKFLLQLMVLHVVQQPQGCAQQETGRRAEMLC